MKKNELKELKNSDLIREAINIYARLLLNYNMKKGTTILEKQWKTCTDELEKRDLLKESDIEFLNM